MRWIIVFVVLVVGFVAWFFFFSGDDDIEITFESPAWALYRGGDYEGAIAQFTEYVGNDDSNYAAYSGLAWSYYQLRDHEQAKAFFEKANQVDPEQYGAYEGLGLIEVRRGNYEAAIEPLTTANNIGSRFYHLFNRNETEESTINFFLGWTQYKLKNYDDALQHFEQSFEAYPLSLFPQIGMFLVHYETNNSNTAIGLAFDIGQFVLLVGDPSLEFNRLGQDYETFVTCMGERDYIPAAVHECGHNSIVE